MAKHTRDTVKRVRKWKFNPKTTLQKCSHCGALEEIKRSEVYQRARQRCSRCGGPLNWLRQA